MKILIEIRGGCFINATATDDVQIYIVDHDNLPDEEEIKEFHPADNVTYEPDDEDTPAFDEILEEIAKECRREEHALDNWTD
jgi:hypothetical protein